MSFVKYRLKEVAADFGVTPKEIGDIISKFYERPKSNSQVLTDQELNAVFEVMTQTHQIDSLEQVFAAQKPKEEPKKEVKAEPSKAEKTEASKAEKAEAPKAEKTEQPAAAQSAQSAKPEKTKEPERKRGLLALRPRQAVPAGCARASASASPESAGSPAYPGRSW